MGSHICKVLCLLASAECFSSNLLQMINSLPKAFYEGSINFEAALETQVLKGFPHLQDWFCLLSRESISLGYLLSQAGRQ